jgi:short-subunit dehydrogenase
MSSPTPRHVLITGAAGAIGGALARRFADRHPKSKLTLVDKNLDGAGELARKWPDRAFAAQWDLARPESLDCAWAAAVRQAGPVDLLVNCAGIMEIRNFASTSWDLGAAMLNINLVSPLKLMNLAVGGMLETGSGCVVNISSMAGRVPIKGCTYYGATKSGIGMASEIAHHELLPKGIHVLTVYPGPVKR